MPFEAQLAPIQGMAVVDLNGDGRDEVITVGNLFGTEVETSRADAGRASMLYCDQSGELKFDRTIGLRGTGDARKVVVIENGLHLEAVIATNNAPIEHGYWVESE